MRQIAGALLLLLFVGLALAQTRMDTKTATLYLRWKYNGVNLTETAYWRVLAYPENEDTTSNAQDTLEYYATAVDTAWIHSPVEYDSYLYYAYNDTLGISLQLRADWLQAGPTAPYGFVDSSFAFCENVVGPYALIEDSSYVVTNLAADSVTIDSALTVPWISTDSLTADSAIVAAAAILTWAQIDSVIWGGDGLDTTNINIPNWQALIQTLQSATGAAAYTDSIRLGATVYDADRWFTATGYIDTTAIDTTQWGAFIRDHQAATGSASCDSTADSLSNAGGEWDVDTFINASGALLGTPADTASWGPVIRSLQSGGGVGMAAADFADSLDAQGFVAADTTSGPLATYTYIAGLGYITGNESITLSGDVTGTGATSITTTLSSDSVDDTHINWGAGAGQVSLADMPDVVSATKTAGNLLIGDGVTGFASTAVSGDATISSLGVVAVADDSHNHTIANVDNLADTLATRLYESAFADSFAAHDAGWLLLAAVEDSVQANAYYPGGTDVADADVVDALTLSTVSGAVDMGAATSLEIPNGADPTTNAAGEIAWDSDDHAIEVYHGGESESALIPVYRTLDALIFQPDQVNDQIVLMRVDALVYPHGIEIDQLSITIPSDAAYSMVFEEWAGDPPTAQNDIDTVSTGAGDSYKEDGTPTDGAIDADDYIVLDIPATDVDWVHVQVIYHVTEGN